MEGEREEEGRSKGAGREEAGRKRVREGGREGGGRREEGQLCHVHLACNSPVIMAF